MEEKRRKLIMDVDTGSDDAVAVAWALNPEVITESHMEKCDVDINGGICDGQLVVDHRRGYAHTPNACVAYRGDREKFMEILCEHLAKGPRRETV